MNTRNLAVLALLSLAAALAAPGAAAQQKIQYMLPAPAVLPAFAPWMLALTRGYYKQEGLDVEFVVGKGGVDVARQVGVGNAVIGGGIGDTPIIVRSQGVPVKAIAVLGGGSLMHLVVHKDSGIRVPADLKGKTISVMAYQDTTYYALLGVLASAGLSKHDVNAQAAGPAGVWKVFASKQAVAMAAVPDWIGDALAAGAQLDYYPSNTYFQSMAQAILASDKAIKEQPELLKKLVRATLRGMKDIMADPRAAAAGYVKAVPAHAGKAEQMAGVFEIYARNVYAGQKQLGAMDAARLASLQEFYLKEGIIQARTPVEELYTNQFLQ
jgi:NitT/TauT family transport system substrate-binding protein